MAATVTHITGTFHLPDGQTVEFQIGTDSGWQQWGNVPDRLSETCGLIDALAEAAVDFLPSDSDPDEDEGDILLQPGEVPETCRHCQRPIVLREDGWASPDANGSDDDAYGCQEHDTFGAEHEPIEDEQAEPYASDQPVEGGYR